MFKNGEIEEVIKMFERPAQQKNLPYTGGSLEKEPRESWKHRIYYTNGAVNNQFLSYLAGYSAGKVSS